MTKSTIVLWGVVGGACLAAVSVLGLVLFSSTPDRDPPVAIETRLPEAPPWIRDLLDRPVDTGDFERIRDRLIRSAPEADLFVGLAHLAGAKDVRLRRQAADLLAGGYPLAVRHVPGLEGLLSRLSRDPDVEVARRTVCFLKGFEEPFVEDLLREHEDDTGPVGETARRGLGNPVREPAPAAAWRWKSGRIRIGGADEVDLEGLEIVCRLTCPWVRAEVGLDGVPYDRVRSEATLRTPEGYEVGGCGGSAGAPALGCTGYRQAPNGFAIEYWLRPRNDGHVDYRLRYRELVGDG